MLLCTTERRRVDKPPGYCKTLIAIPMPYLIYKIEGEQRTYLTEFDTYRAARDHVRGLRASNAGDKRPDEQGGVVFRLVFAADREEAIALLGEKRIAPVLKEWEK